MSEPSRRTKRVAKAIRDHVAAYLVTQTGDERLTRVVVTDVNVSDDLGVARVSVRLLTGSSHAADYEPCIKQLQLVSGRVRRSLGTVLGLRRVPELRFQYDDGYDAHMRVEQILREIHTGPKEKP